MLFILLILFHMLLLHLLIQPAFHSFQDINNIILTGEDFGSEFPSVWGFGMDINKQVTMWLLGRISESITKPLSKPMLKQLPSKQINLILISICLHQTKILCI